MRPRRKPTAAEIAEAAAPPRRPWRRSRPSLNQLGPAYTVGSMVTTTSSTAVWDTWMQQATTTFADAANTISNHVWTTWNTSTTNGSLGYRGTAPPDTRTEWEKRRDRLVLQNRNRARYMRTRVAKRTAEELLLSTFTVEERDEWEALDRVTVIAPDGATYRIRRGWAGNIDVIEGDDEIVERWCVHPSRPIPEADNVLGQKLMIESGHADELRGIANVTRLQPRRAPTSTITPEPLRRGEATGEVYRDGVRIGEIENVEMQVEYA